MAFPPTFTNNWDVTQPPDTQLANLLGQDLRNFRVDVMQRMSALSGTLANRPTPEIVNATWGGAGFGLIYISTDTKQLFQWNGAAWVDISGALIGGGYKFEGINIVPGTLAGANIGTPLTTLQSIALAANEIGASQTFYIDASGVFTGIPLPGSSYGIQLSIDGVLVGGASPGTGANNTRNWSFRTFFSCISSGVGGSISACSSIYTDGSGAAISDIIPSGVVAIDTTVPHQLQIQALFGGSAIGASATSNVMVCYRVG